VYMFKRGRRSVYQRQHMQPLCVATGIVNPGAEAIHSLHRLPDAWRFESDSEAHGDCRRAPAPTLRNSLDAADSRFRWPDDFDRQDILTVPTQQP